MGVSPSPLSSTARTLAGTSMPYFLRSRNASAQVVGSATVGPEAMSPGPSPGTSEIARVTSFAGAQAWASRPPLMPLRWRRTQFISEMVAPLFSSARLTACLSARSSPGNGIGSSAEPPPEISAMTRSSGDRPDTSALMRRAASAPASSGTGWLASRISMCAQGAAWP